MSSVVSEQIVDKLPSVEGYVGAVGVSTVLRHIVKTEPDSILQLPLVTRERTSCVKTRVTAIQHRENREREKLKKKSAHLQSQLTKSVKQRVKVEGWSSAAKTRLKTAKTSHASEKADLILAHTKAVEKIKRQHHKVRASHPHMNDQALTLPTQCCAAHGSC